MKEILTVGDRTFEVAGPLTPELKAHVMQQILYKVQGRGGCISCGSAKAGMVKLGTATCGGPYVQNTQKTLTGSVTSGGTAPFTYTWTVTPPSGPVETYTGATKLYTWALAGTYGIRLDVVDNCPVALDGPKSDYATCSVVITATCVDPVCDINIA